MKCFRKLYLGIFTSVLTVSLLAEPCVSVCAAPPVVAPPGPSPEQLQALLQALEDEWIVEGTAGSVRANAYQYALERHGYDVQPGVDAMQVIGAMETASQLADYAFQEDEDYQAAIQYVEDRSGLPDSLQGLNAELYFAKIDYLDMQIGVYMDEKGRMLGNAIVQYKEGIEETLRNCIASVRDNVLGKEDLSAIGMEESFILKQGRTDGYNGLVGYAWSLPLGNFGEYDRNYRGSWYKILDADADARFFLASIDGQPRVLYCIARTAPLVKYALGKKISSLDDFGSVISSAVVDDLFATRDGNWVADPLLERGGYHLYYGEYYHSFGITDRFGYNSPFLILDMTPDELTEWFRTDFVPAPVPGGSGAMTAVGLNPNGVLERLSGKSFGLDSLVEHNRAVSDTMPENAPLADPYPEPLPENAPLYEPVSGLETIPKPEPLPFPEYTPLPDTEPSPEPGTDPDLDPDSPFKPVPAKGIQDKFPFCIPFDLVDAFELFVAEPETPVWKFSFNIPEINRTVEFEIDLSMFDDLARLTRLLLMAAFIIALIVGTRSLISN